MKKVLPLMFALISSCRMPPGTEMEREKKDERKDDKNKKQTRIHDKKEK